MRWEFTIAYLLSGKRMGTESCKRGRQACGEFNEELFSFLHVAGEDTEVNARSRRRIAE
jgi:hypothetical protein